MVFTETASLDKLKGTKQDPVDFAVQFTYDSQAIEGSTVTLEETQVICRDDWRLMDRKKEFILETRDHYEVVHNILEEKDPLSMSLIQKWHYKQFNKTMPKIAGLPRTVDVGIFGTNIRFPNWRAVPYHLIEFFRWYDRVQMGIHPVYLAAFAHLKFVNIHPFEDGNGRTSRLLMNYILHKNGFPMLNIPLKNRRRYFEAINMGRQYDEWEFVTFICKSMLGTLDEQRDKVDTSREVTQRVPEDRKD